MNPDDTALCLACGDTYPEDEEHDCDMAEQMTKRPLRDMMHAADGEFRR